MPILSGPAVGLNSIVSSMLRSQTGEPFAIGLAEAPPMDVRYAILQQVLRVLTKLVDAMTIVSAPLPEPEDDFMKGWGEPGGDLD